MAEFPMKEWFVQLYLIDQDGKEQPANCFTKVTYNLHPSFENPQQSRRNSSLATIVLRALTCVAAFHKAPFTCKNEGWGEFEMSIDMFTTEKGGKITVYHDLNFAAPKYDNVQTISFKNPSQNLLNMLRETGPVNNDDDNRAAKARKVGDFKKRKTGWDYEKLADGLSKLSEDDLLHVIQMIHDNKSDDTYTKNDIEAGEFSVDLFTLPDSLTKTLWDFLVCSCLPSPQFSRCFLLTCFFFTGRAETRLGRVTSLGYLLSFGV